MQDFNRSTECSLPVSDGENVPVWIMLFELDGAGYWRGADVALYAVFENWLMSGAGTSIEYVSRPVDEV